jgi:hypothetical protein
MEKEKHEREVVPERQDDSQHACIHREANGRKKGGRIYATAF